MRLSIISIHLLNVFHLLLKSIAALEDLRDKECSQVFVVMEITDDLVDQIEWCVLWFELGHQHFVADFSLDLLNTMLHGTSLIDDIVWFVGNQEC